MPVSFFVGGIENEQAVGKTLDSGAMRLYAISRSNPTNMIYIGGHPMDEAFSYTLTERKIAPEYRHVGGRNVLVERTLTGDKVKGLTVNLKLPNKMISVTDRIYQSINKGRKYDLLLVPSSCEEGCESFFWLGEDMDMGVRQYNSAIVGWDENENPITSMRSLALVGNLRHYYGLEHKELVDESGAVNSAVIIEEDCEVTDCPYQWIAYGGAANLFKFTKDGGRNWTTVTATALTTEVTGGLITSIVHSNMNYVVGVSTGFKTTGTDGAIGYSVDGASFVVATLLDTAGAATTSTGVNKILHAFNKLWAFGTAGEIFFSVDDGVTWTEFASTITEDIYDAAFDASTQKVYLVGGNAVAYSFDGYTITDITSAVGATAATDLLSVAVTGENHVVIGGANGRIYQYFGEEWVASAIGTTPVNAIAGDGFSVRVLAGVDDELFLREALTEQKFVKQLTAGGDITSIVPGKALLDEGVNYFLVTTAAGEVIQFATCNFCIEV